MEVQYKHIKSNLRNYFRNIAMEIISSFDRAGSNESDLFQSYYIGTVDYGYLNSCAAFLPRI